MKLALNGTIIGEVAETPEEGVEGRTVAHLTDAGAAAIKAAGDFGLEYQCSYRASEGTHRFVAHGELGDALTMVADATAAPAAEEKPKRKRSSRRAAAADDGDGE